MFNSVKNNVGLPIGKRENVIRMCRKVINKPTKVDGEIPPRHRRLRKKVYMEMLNR